MTALPLTVGVAMKWVALHPEVDSMTGVVTADPRLSGPSPADKAALEWGLRLGKVWGRDVVVACVGPRVATVMLRQALAVGASRAVHVVEAGLTSEEVAMALDEALAPADLLLCGDASLDRGSGSVPAFLAARRGVPQALGLVSLEAGGVGVLVGLRRLDGGRRERVRVDAPAVVSVEGHTAKLRRSSLGTELRSRTTPISVASAPVTRVAGGGGARLVATRPFRPRAKVLAPPDPSLDARQRILALTGALAERTPPRTLVLEPGAAAEAILTQLHHWDYL